MIESVLVRDILDIVLVVMVLMLALCTWRVAIGPSPADRLQAIDTTTNLLIGIIVVLALVQGRAFLVDVALALAAFGFVATVAISRYISEGRMF